MTRKHLQLSADNKKIIYCYKTLAFSDGTSLKRFKKPCCRRVQGRVYGKRYHTSFWLLLIDLMNLYNSSGSVRVRTRPGRAHVTTLRPYRVNTLTNPHSRFTQQPLLLSVYGVHAQKILNYFIQKNGNDILQHDNARPHTTRK